MTNTPPDPYGPGDEQRPGYPHNPGDQPHPQGGQPYPQQPGQPYPGQAYPGQAGQPPHQQQPYPQQGHQPGFPPQGHQPGHPHPPQQGESGKRAGLIIGGSVLAAVVLIGGTVGILGLAGAFSDETREPLTESQIEHLLVEEDDFPFSGNFSEDVPGGWLPADAAGWTQWFPDEDAVADYYEYDAEEDETDWGACLESMTPFYDADPQAEAESSVMLEGDEQLAVVGISTLEEAPEFDDLWSDVISACEGEFVDEDDEAGQEVVRLDESGFEGINIIHEETSSALVSMDHGENLVWVAAMDMSTEELEELLEAQRERLSEGLED